MLLSQAWDDVAAVTRSGPLRALALSRGEAFMAEAREAFLAEVPPGPVAHAPAARWILARRAAG